MARRGAVPARAVPSAGPALARPGDAAPHALSLRRVRVRGAPVLLALPRMPGLGQLSAAPRRRALICRRLQAAAALPLSSGRRSRSAGGGALRVPHTSIRELVMIKKILAVTAMLFAAASWAAVDANKATEAELDGLKGVGPALTKRIIEARKQS